MHRLHLETFGNVHALPVLHYRMEFAWLVREAFRKVRPDCIAVELPPTLEEGVVRAVRRLPEISAVTYRSGTDTVHLLVEPADPLIEASRLALENDIPLKLVDLDLDSYPPTAKLFPTATPSTGSASAPTTTPSGAPIPGNRRRSTCGGSRGWPTVCGNWRKSTSGFSSSAAWPTWSG